MQIFFTGPQSLQELGERAPRKLGHQPYNRHRWWWLHPCSHPPVRSGHTCSSISTVLILTRQTGLSSRSLANLTSLSKPSGFPSMKNWARIALRRSPVPRSHVCNGSTWTPRWPTWSAKTFSSLTRSMILAQPYNTLWTSSRRMLRKLRSSSLPMTRGRTRRLNSLSSFCTYVVHSDCRLIGLADSWNRTRKSPRRVSCPQIWRTMTSVTTPRSPLGMSGSATLGRLSMLYLQLHIIRIVDCGWLLFFFSCRNIEEHDSQAKLSPIVNIPQKREAVQEESSSKWLHYHKHSLLCGALMVYIWDTFSPRFCCPCSDQVHKTEHVIFTISLMRWIFIEKVLYFWQIGRPAGCPQKTFCLETAIALLASSFSFFFLKQSAP